jgi:hypothetical protein
MNWPVKGADRAAPSSRIPTVFSLRCQFLVFDREVEKLLLNRAAASFFSSQPPQFRGLLPVVRRPGRKAALLHAEIPPTVRAPVERLQSLAHRQ